MDEIIKEIIRGDCIITLPWDPAYKKYSLGNRVNDRVIYRGCTSLQIYKQPASVVFWAKDHISIIKTTVNANIFSFEFSGCSMARYKIENQEYAAHIHSCDNYKEDCRDEWIDYVSQKNIISLRMFCPQSIQKTDDCWGLISKEGNCYSIGVKQLNFYNQQDISDIRNISHIPVRYKVVYIREHLVGKTCFEYRPILEHGMKLQLGKLTNQDCLIRRHAVTRNQWIRFWEQIRYKDWLRFTYLY